jgi:hypothetical protein
MDEQNVIDEGISDKAQEAYEKFVRQVLKDIGEKLTASEIEVLIADTVDRAYSDVVFGVHNATTDFVA